MKRVVVGMSGGVDSAVSAYLLTRRRNLDVVGAFMKNWDIRDEDSTQCTADADAECAESVCKRLNIPFYHFDHVKEYWNEVFLPLLTDYENGFTPNPDILCNRRIKFDHFHNSCMDKIGCDAIATGHYARNSYGEDLEYSKEGKNAKLLISGDPVKDQTFFLSRIDQRALRRHVFPVGGLNKAIVKDIAAKNGFKDIAAKKESMGICFIGKRSFQQFIGDYVDDKPGKIIDVDDGNVLGSHRGIHQWTIGQRIPLSKKSGHQPEKTFAVSKDVKNNILFACFGSDHPALFCTQFFAQNPHWISGRPPDELRHGDKTLQCEFRVQNTQPLMDCRVSLGMTSTVNFEYMDQARLTVSSVQPLRAVTPGQYVVLYKGSECLGSAVIERTLTDQFQKTKS